MPEHPDFLAVAEEHRWAKPLNELFPALRKQAWTLRGGWAWRVLPHGAMVAVRIRPPEEGKESAFQLELRIARKTPPADEVAWKRWATEVATFLRHLTGDEGDWRPLPGTANKAEALFTFVTRDKPKVLCARCGKREALDPGVYKEDLCQQCAMELGSEEAAQRRPGGSTTAPGS